MRLSLRNLMYNHKNNDKKTDYLLLRLITHHLIMPEYGRTFKNVLTATKCNLDITNNKFELRIVRENVFMVQPLNAISFE